MAGTKTKKASCYRHPVCQLPIAQANCVANGIFALLLLQGQSGNAVQYVTRNQALKKLQLKLAEFR